MANAVPKEVEDKVIEMNGSYTQQEVATELNISLPTVRHICSRRGVIWQWQRRDQFGDQNTQYKDGMGRSTIERLTRRVVVADDRDPFKCEKCGVISTTVQHAIHHVDRNRSNNVATNLTILCSSCHRKEHSHETKRDTISGKFVS